MHFTLSFAIQNIFSLNLLHSFAAAAAAKSLQLCPTLCDPIDGSPPDSPIPGILQARTLEWVAISFSNAWKWKVKVKSLSRVRPSATPWTAAYQAPPSMGFSRQEYWSGVPLPSLTGSSVFLKSLLCWGHFAKLIQLTMSQPRCQDFPWSLGSEFGASPVRSQALQISPIIELITFFILLSSFTCFYLFYHISSSISWHMLRRCLISTNWWMIEWLTDTCFQVRPPL